MSLFVLLRIMGHLLGIMGEFVGNNQVVVQALQSRIIGTFWSILASLLDIMKQLL